jgi:hypothetical protein
MICPHRRAQRGEGAGGFPETKAQDQKGEVMRKALFTIIMLMAAGPLSFAQQKLIYEKYEPANPDEKRSVVLPQADQTIDWHKYQTLEGTVASVSNVDPDQGVPATLIVIDQQGQEVAFRLSLTVVLHTDNSQVGITDLAKGQAVRVSYDVAEDGTKLAASVTIIP